MSRSGSAYRNAEGDDTIRAEYVRSMNKKDLEVQRLLTENKRLELEAKKEHERTKCKQLDLRAEIDRLRSDAGRCDSSRHTEQTVMAELRVERDALRSDVSLLKDTVEKQEHQLRQLYKTAQKMEKAEHSARQAMDAEGRAHHHEMEDRLAKANQRIESLVDQRTDTDQECSTLRRELERWKNECENNRRQITETETMLKDTRNQQRDMLPNSTVSAEVRQLEARHTAIVGGLEKEVGRLRDEARERALVCGRQDAVAEDHRRKIETLEATVQMTSRKAQELAADNSMSQLQHHHLEAEWKGEHMRAVDQLKDTIDRLTKDRGQMEGELIISQRRVAELEAAGSLASRRFAEDSQAGQKETLEVRQKLQLETSEAAEAKRRCDLLSSENDRLQAKLESLRDISGDQIATLKSDVEQAANLIASGAAKNKHLDQVVDDLRQQLDQRNQDVVGERSAAMQTEHALRTAHAEALGQIRAKDEERQQQLRRHEDELEQLSEQHRAEGSRINKEYKDEVAKLQGALRQANEKGIDMSSALEQQIITIESLEGKLKAKMEKEQQLLVSYREVDKEASRLKYEAAEKDGSVVTLQRTLESADASLKAARHELEAQRSAFENERRKNSRLEEQVTSSAEQNVLKDRDNHDLADSVTRYKTLNAQLLQDTDAQIGSLRQKLQAALNDLAIAEHSAVTLKTDLGREQETRMLETSRVEQRHSDECAQLQREVLVPLQEKVDQLVQQNQRQQQDLTDRDFKLQELSTLQRRNENLALELRDAQDTVQVSNRRAVSLEEDLKGEREQTAILHRVQREKQVESDEVRRLRADNESLVRKIGSLESGIGNATRDITDVRSRELDLNTELQRKRAEVSTLKEQLANLESVKLINEKALRSARSDAEDVKQSYITLQTQFAKQQDQLENAARLSGRRI